MLSSAGPTWPGKNDQAAHSMSRLFVEPIDWHFSMRQMGSAHLT